MMTQEEFNFWLNESQTENEENVATTKRNEVKNTPEAYYGERTETDTYQQVCEVVQRVVQAHADLTDNYNDWFQVGSAFAAEFGEAGRNFFHEVSRMSNKYDATECDKKYNDCLRNNRNQYTIGTFFQKAKDASIDIRTAQTQKPVCANCADAHKYTGKEEKDNYLIISSNNKMNNSKDTCAIAQTAQNELEEIVFNSTFTNKTEFDDWCNFLRPIFVNVETPEGRDKQMLGTIGVISGLIPENYYAIYNQKEIFTPLDLIIYGNAASGKGELPHIMGILNPLKKEIEASYQAEMATYRQDHALWEAKSGKGERTERGPEPQEPEFRTPLIPGNSSATAAILQLKANNNWGVIFETEGDVISNSFKSDYGDYSTLLRKAAHHEPVAISRVKDKLHFEIAKPRLAVIITLTPGQLRTLFPSFENGLGSRFYFYGLNRKLEWHNPFKVSPKPLKEVFSEMGEQYLELHHEILKLGDRRIQFVFSDEQQQKFNEFFSELLLEQFSMLGEGIESFVFRLGLSFTRTAMILALLRRYSDWDRSLPLFGEHEQAMVCNDKDFRITMAIVDTLVNHTAKIFATLNKEEDRNIFKHHVELTAPERNLYFALPENFTSQDVKQTAISLGINPDTARRYCGKYVEVGIAERITNGHYRKINMKK